MSGASGVSSQDAVGREGIVSSVGSCKKVHEQGSEMPRVYADIRQGEVDFVVLDDRRMLLASTQRWHDRMDIAYHVFNMMDVYGLNPANTQVSLSGEREIKHSLLSRRCGSRSHM